MPHHLKVTELEKLKAKLPLLRNELTPSMRHYRYGELCGIVETLHRLGVLTLREADNAVLDIREAMQSKPVLGGGA